MIFKIGKVEKIIPGTFYVHACRLALFVHFYMLISRAGKGYEDCEWKIGDENGREKTDKKNVLVDAGEETERSKTDEENGQSNRVRMCVPWNFSRLIKIQAF